MPAYLCDMAGINIGDEVRFINEQLTGTVTSLKINGLAGVTIEDGFEIDVPVNELVVVVRSAAPAASEIRQAPKPVSMPKAREGFWWQVSETDAGFQVHFWNHTEHPVLFTAYREGITATELLLAGRAEPGELKTLANVKGKERSRRGRFHITVLTVRNLPAKVPEPVSHVFDFESFNAVNPDHLTHDARHWLISVSRPAATAEPAQISVKPATASNPPVSRPDEVIDLHAPALGLEGLNGDSILKKQMDEFHRQLELALAWEMPEITFIHGSGSGVLRNLIQIALKGHSGVRQFSEAAPLKFGQGAIRIQLK